MNKSWLLFIVLIAVLTTAGLIVLYRTPVSATPTERDTLHGATGAGNDNARIEYETKLRVPLEQLDEVWEWLGVRYADCSWLNLEDEVGRPTYVFQAEFGDEDFTDTYFDTPDLRMLAKEGGVRRRRRVVHSGPATEKDSRQLLQIKLDHGDVTGVARAEIKFEVPTNGTGNSLDAAHPLLNLVHKNQREEFYAIFRALNIDAYTMQPVLTLQQNRRRVYLSDQAGAFATLTLDLCSTSSWGTNLKWAEAELELNEIRYTEANAVEQQRMAQVIEKIQGDLQQTFPSMVQDQMPKYNTAFMAIESASWLPIRRLIQWRMSSADFIAIGLIFLVTMCSALWYIGRR
jgi:hypothetical protein